MPYVKRRSYGYSRSRIAKRSYRPKYKKTYKKPVYKRGGYRKTGYKRKAYRR